LSRAIWAIALPAMLTNVATALFGLADMWVIGQLGDAPAQAAVEVGAKFMLALLIVFNFLRSGTTALTAQAVGRGDQLAEAATLARAIGVALLIGAGLLLLMPLAIPFGLEFLHARGSVAEDATVYIGIRDWGGLLWLLNAALVGWLIGRRRVREVLVVEVLANLVHVALDVGFVLGLGWGVAGVAFATLLSEAAKLLALALVAAREPPAAKALDLFRRAATWNRVDLAALFRLNRDLFLRTMLLITATLLMTRDGAHEGALVLAANGILYQLFMLSALILDGFESAAQVLGGEAAGARDRRQFQRLVRALLLWGLAGGLLLSILYAVAGRPLAASFSTDPAVIETTLAYLPWVVALPLLSVTSFMFDGIYIGATWTRALLATMAAAFVAYGTLLLVTGPLGNHGLWLAFTLFFVARAAGQALLLPRLRRQTFRS
jgi:MATE family multidrug resistance protein